MSSTQISSYSIWTVPAAEELSEKQFYLVSLNSDAEAELAGAGDLAFVLNNTPKAGEGADLVIAGPVMKAKAGGTIAPMDLIAGNASHQIVQAAEGDKTLGIALESAVAGDVAFFVYLPGAGYAVPSS